MLAHWDEDLVVPVVDGMIDQFVDRGRAELVNEFTYRYPVQVIAEILGLSRDDHEYFHPRALALINVAVRPDEGIIASTELRDYFRERGSTNVRSTPGTDLISELCQAELDGETLGDEEIFSFLRLLPAGAETTYRATGSFIYGLLTHPDQLEALRADRSLMPRPSKSRSGGRARCSSRHASARATRSSRGSRSRKVRWSSRTSVQRTTARDVGLTDDEFDIFREPQPHIAFGVGVHMCLGMHLRMEMASAMNRLLDRCPNLRRSDRWNGRHYIGERFRSPNDAPGGVGRMTDTFEIVETEHTATPWRMVMIMGARASRTSRQPVVLSQAIAPPRPAFE